MEGKVHCFVWPEKMTHIKLEDGPKIDKNVWICFLTQLENGAAHSNRYLLTRFGCTPTNEPLWEIPKKTPYIVGMKIAHNPQENPQIYLVISTHLKNLLIKLHHFSKKSWGKKQKKRKPTITWTLDASCYSKHQWVGTCFGMTNSSGVGQKCLLFVVCLWVFFNGGLWCWRKWYLLGFFLGGSLIWEACWILLLNLLSFEKNRSKTPPKMETCFEKNANYPLCVVFLG